MPAPDCHDMPDAFTNTACQMPSPICFPIRSTHINASSCMQTCNNFRKADVNEKKQNPRHVHDLAVNAAKGTKVYYHCVFTAR